MGKLHRQTFSRTVVQFRPFQIERRQEDDLPAHIKGAAVYLKSGEQEGYFVFDILANKYLAVKYCYVFTEPSYLIALPDSLSLGLSSLSSYLPSHPLCAPCITL
jgi:hypothetical protein